MHEWHWIGLGLLCWVLYKGPFTWLSDWINGDGLPDWGWLVQPFPYPDECFDCKRGSCTEPSRCPTRDDPSFNPRN